MRITGIGDNVVDRYLTLGQMFPGGNALNVAVLAHRAGVDAAYIGALGDDAAGAVVLQALVEEGVDVSRVRTVPGPNAYADVVLEAGNRRFVGSSLGVSRFEPDAADLAFLSTSDLVHSSMYSGLDEWVRAVRGELPLSFDFSDRTDVETVSALAPGLRCAAFSAAHLSVGAARDLVEWTVSLGAECALATRGAGGAVLWADGRCWDHPAHPTSIVDTLGAGDAFIAAFLVARLRGAAPSEALSLGAAGAATTCAHFGAFGRGGVIESYPTMLSLTSET